MEPGLAGWINVVIYRTHSYVTSPAHSPTFPSLHLRHNSSPTLPSLYLRHSSFSNPSFASPTSQALLILQPYRHFTYVTTHSPTLPSLYLRHNSFCYPSVASSTSVYSPTLLSLLLRHKLCSFSNLSVTSPTSQLILHPFRCFTYVTTHSPTLPLIHLCHSSFSNPSVASPASQLIFQLFFHFSYITGPSLTPPGEPPMI